MADLTIITIDADLADYPVDEAISWSASDSVTVEGEITRAGTLETFPSGAVATMEAWVRGTPNTLYVDLTGTASDGSYSISADPGETNLAAGNYDYAIRIRNADNSIISTIKRGVLTVREAPATEGVDYVGTVSPFLVSKAGDVDDAAKAVGKFLQVAADGVTHEYVASVGGVTDHGALTGLSDDDHTQYHNDARGDARYAPLAHVSDTANPHGVTKTQVGLGNADNTADADKPVSSAQQAALDAKQDLLTPASQAEMEAGVETALRSMSPLRVAQAIAALGGGGGYIHPVTFVPEEFSFDVAEASGAIGWKPSSLDQAWAQAGGVGLQTSLGTSQNAWIRCNKPLPAWSDWRASRAIVLHFWCTDLTSALALEVWGYDSDTISKATQVHDGANGATTLSDSTKNWTTNALATRGVRNITAGTSDVITSNTATTFTTLGGMTFDNGDLYVLMPVAVLSEIGIVAATENELQEVAYDKADLSSTTMWQYLAVNVRFSSASGEYPVMKMLEVWGA